MKCKFNLLVDDLFTVICTDGKSIDISLPAVYDLLHRDKISSFKGLRQHQWQSWHCFLVQCGSLALLHDNSDVIPDSEDSWRKVLRGLTHEFADDEPWCLYVENPEKPAFMQVPVPAKNMPDYKSVVRTPDSLDMLVTAKNHDVKQHCAKSPSIQYWIFSLISLQTMEGFLGSGNYGASRMNGGFSNRCFMGLAPAGGLGAHVIRDIKVLLENFNDIANEYKPTFGRANSAIGLVWLVPWDGTGPLPMQSLHPFYIEVCRRVRVVGVNAGVIVVKTAGSKKERIDAKVLNGNTADPWAPLVRDKDGFKSITITSGGFDYRMVCRLLFGQQDGYVASLMSKPFGSEIDTQIIFSALVRGQGKTEGLRQRRIPMTLTAAKMMRRRSESSVGKTATGRVRTVSEIQKHLRRCIALQSAGAPSLADGKLDFNASGDGDRDRAQKFSEAFEQYIDSIFFDELWKVAELHGEEIELAEQQWNQKITRKAEAFLDQSAGGMPRRGHLHRGTRAKVKNFFLAYAWKNEWLIESAQSSEEAL